MKTDTEYFHLAVDAWIKKNRYSANLPTTPSWFSEMMRDAQALKDADRKKLEAEPAV
jgi:hypothetical protein